MVRITWLGSEDYREGESPLESCVWNGVMFTAGDKVEVNDAWMIAKARGNRFFKVENGGTPNPETWTNDPPPPVEEPPRYPTTPPDYPPEDEPEREPNKKRKGRPRRIRDNGDADQ
jgi:hypothetical protein